MRRTTAILAAIAALAIAHAVHADASASPLRVGRAEAVRLGGERGPGIAVAAAPRAGMREAHASATSLPRPPTLAIAGGYRAGSITPGPELSVTVTQDVALRGLGSARARSADALGRAIESDVTRARLDAAERAALAWATALEAKEILRLRSDALAQAQGILQITRARVNGGVGMPYEVALAEGEVGAANAAVLDAEGMEVEALAELRFALGLSPTDAVDAIDDLYTTDERPIDEASAVRAAEEHPLIAFTRARADAAAEEVRLTRATLGPALSVGGSYVREGTGDQIVTAIVGVPLPFFDAAAFESARQRATQQTDAAQVDRVRAEVARDVRLALHDRVHWREVRDALKGTALTPMREALRLARAQYEAGTQDVSFLLLARQRLIAIEEQLAHVAAEVQRADIRLAHATGSLRKEPRRP